MPADQRLPIAWTLTSTSMAGVQRGTTEVPVYPERPVYLHPQSGLSRGRRVIGTSSPIDVHAEDLQGLPLLFVVEK